MISLIESGMVTMSSIPASRLLFTASMLGCHESAMMTMNGSAQTRE